MYFEKNNGLVLNSLGKANAVNVYDDNGKLVLLSKVEQMIADEIQKSKPAALKMNALGADVDITTLTTIIAERSKQKFFEVSMADFMAVRVGEGSMSQQLTAFREFQTGGAFDEGFINQGSNTKLAGTGVAVEAVYSNIYNWAKELQWNLLELGQAAKAGNWELVTALEGARKKNWDLGLQDIFFLGHAERGIKGFLTLPGVKIDKALIKKRISVMTAVELSAFVSGSLVVYRETSQHTAWPDLLEIPESDYLGLATPSDPNFPLKTKLDVLLETYRTMTKNPNFQILPLAYGNKAINAKAGIGQDRYVLTRIDSESSRFDIPTDYTPTIANTINGFQFVNVAYGQIAGAMVLRERETLYMDLTP